jgi:hypothetical protein
MFCALITTATFRSYGPTCLRCLRNVSICDAAHGMNALLPLFSTSDATHALAQRPSTDVLLCPIAL